MTQEDTRRAAIARDHLKRPAAMENELALLYARLDRLPEVLRGVDSSRVPGESGESDFTARYAAEKADLEREIVRLSRAANAARRQCARAVEAIPDPAVRETVRRADLEGQRYAYIAESLFMDERTFYRCLKKGRLIVYHLLAEQGVTDADGSSPPRARKKD